MFYILDEDGNPKHTEDVEEWSRFRSSGRVQVALTEFANGATLSTVFLGYDHGFRNTVRDNADPILWETMLFCSGHALDQCPIRSSAREQAIAHHEDLVERLCRREGFHLAVASVRAAQAKQPALNRKHKPRIRVR